MRRTSVLAAVAVTSVLALSACGSDSSDGGDGETASTTTDSGITVEGAAGEKPTLDIPDEDPSGELVVEVLEEGEGAEVGATDSVVAHYLGQTWKDVEEGTDNVFDNSYDREIPSIFSLDGVVPGWKEGLAGQAVGSRVLLTIPPDLGYGAEESETIPADSTLTFVVEILDTVPAGAAASGEPVTDLPAGLPTITSNEGAAPTLDFAAATPPAESTSTTVITGDGEELGDNLIVQLTQASYPDGADVISTWDQQGPQIVPQEQFASVPGFAEALEGQKVGSRVVAQIAAADNPPPEGAEGGEPTALVLVIDIVGTF